MIGFVSSAVSDTVSNPIRVVKTTTQTSAKPTTYLQSLQTILQEDGLNGLLFRGLTTKVLSNGAQGLLFSVLWKLLLDVLEQRNVTAIV